MNIPLKEKYQIEPNRKSYDPKGAQTPEGFSRVYSVGTKGKYKTRTGNSHGPTPKVSGKTVGSRRRCYNVHST